MFHRMCFGLALAAMITAAPAFATPSAPSAMPATPALSGEAALKRLLEGNQRFVTDQSLPRPSVVEHRAALARQQRPVAVVVGCADSRVPPELLFDQGLGELFVIRVAGHVINDAVLGSVEYAVEHLDVPLVVVLGHERCGAVQASLGSSPGHGHLPALTSPIQPAVALAKDRVGDTLDQTVMTNVLMGVTQLRVSQPTLATRVRNQQVLIVGARYDLDSGEVHVLPARMSLEPAPNQMPWQSFGEIRH